MMMMSIEWHLLAWFVLVLGLAITPLLGVAAAMFLTPIFWAIVAGIQAPEPKHVHWLSRPLITWLHFRQPIVRGWARYHVRLKNKIMVMRKKRVATVASNGCRSIRTIPTRSSTGTRIMADSSCWKRSPRKSGPPAGASAWTAGGMGGIWKSTPRAMSTCKSPPAPNTTMAWAGSPAVRVKPMMSNFCRALMVSTTVLAVVLLLDMFPFSRIAVLLPLTVWAMYLVNRWLVSNPVLGLIDEVAEKSIFYPVFPKKTQKEKKPADTTPRQVRQRQEADERAQLNGFDLEPGEPSVA